MMNDAGHSFLTADDRLDLIQCVSGISFHADIGKWDRVADFYDDAVTMDYSLLIGREPSTLDRASLIAFFQSSLTQWDAVQHIISNVQIQAESKDLVETNAHVQSVQIFKGRPWTISGYFTHRWRRYPTGWKAYWQRLTPLFELDPTGVKQEWMVGLNK